LHPVWPGTDEAGTEVRADARDVDAGAEGAIERLDIPLKELLDG
jgi:hypothetical protein